MNIAVTNKIIVLCVDGFKGNGEIFEAVKRAARSKELKLIKAWESSYPPFPNYVEDKTWRLRRRVAGN